MIKAQYQFESLEGVRGAILSPHPPTGCPSVSQFLSLSLSFPFCEMQLMTKLLYSKSQGNQIHDRVFVYTALVLPGDDGPTAPKAATQDRD